MKYRIKIKNQFLLIVLACISFQFSAQISPKLADIVPSSPSADGLNLDFTNPALPKMDLGNMQTYDGKYAKFAYIQSGNLYFDSTSTSDQNAFEYALSVDLSSYQSVSATGHQSDQPNR